jgi:hypothetical protein
MGQRKRKSLTDQLETATITLVRKGSVAPALVAHMACTGTYGHRSKVRNSHEARKKNNENKARP